MGSKSKLLDKNHTRYKRVFDKIGFEIKKALFIFDCDFEKDDKNCNGMKKSLECFENLKKECYKHFDKLIYLFKGIKNDNTTSNRPKRW
jgi:hypothetical protein